MTPKSVAAIAAIVASFAFAGFTPAMAQDAKELRAARHDRMLEFRPGAAGRFEFAQFSCAPRAADRMERRFDRLADRLKLSDAQQKLYDTFMASALTAQTGLADKCGDFRPTSAAGAKPERPDLVERMEIRLKFDEARLAAMNAVLPDFKAFYGSLDEAQQRDLFPRGRGGHDNPRKPRPSDMNG